MPSSLSSTLALCRTGPLHRPAMQPLSRGNRGEKRTILSWRCGSCALQSITFSFLSVKMSFLFIKKGGKHKPAPALPGRGDRGIQILSLVGATAYLTCELEQYGSGQHAERPRREVEHRGPRAVDRARSVVLAPISRQHWPCGAAST